MQQPSWQFVAHRGCPVRFPENSLWGVDYALRCGARWLEVDVQLTAEGTPVLCHDPTLMRSSRWAKPIASLTLAEIQTHGAAYAERFGSKFRGVPFATLEQLCRLIRHHNSHSPHEPSRVFVELKAESARQLGYALMIDQVAQVLSNTAQAEDVAAVISFDLQLCESLRHTCWPVGWVIPAWNDDIRQRAAALAPQFLFCDIRVFPDRFVDIWPGPWKWAIYTVNEAEPLRRLAALACGFCRNGLLRPDGGHLPSALIGYTSRPSTRWITARTSSVMRCGFC